MESQATRIVVLVIGKDRAMREQLRSKLSGQFHVVTTSGQALRLGRPSTPIPDIIVIADVRPSAAGLRRMAKSGRTGNLPVILCGEQAEPRVMAEAIDHGADDYVLRSVGGDELGARIRAVLRGYRQSVASPRVVEVGDLLIDLERRQVQRGGRAVALGGTEWLLLEQLTLNAGGTVLHEELQAKVWGPYTRTKLQHLRVWIGRLRKKLESGQSRYIRTVGGIGYALMSEEPNRLGKR